MMDFKGKNKVFYDKCLSELQSRANFSETWLPVLDQYVFNLVKIEALMKEIESESVAVDHTNKAGHTNAATAPKWRMYLELTKAAAALAKDLQLNPATSPVMVQAKKKGFELGKMKVA